MRVSQLAACSVLGLAMACSAAVASAQESMPAGEAQYAAQGFVSPKGNHVGAMKYYTPSSTVNYPTGRYDAPGKNLDGYYTHATVDGQGQTVQAANNTVIPVQQPAKVKARPHKVVHHVHHIHHVQPKHKVVHHVHHVKHVPHVKAAPVNTAQYIHMNVVGAPAVKTTPYVVFDTTVPSVDQRTPEGWLSYPTVHTINDP